MATAFTSLTLLLDKEGKLPEAEAAGRQAVAMQKQLLGPEHPDAANALGNLAGVLEDEGNLEQAEAMQREALAIRRKALGPEHPLLAMSLHELGLVLKKRGHLPDSISDVEEEYRDLLAALRS